MKQSLPIALLLSSCAAFRPYVDGRTPWYKTSPKVDKIEFPHDYVVPSYGEDPEILATQNSINVSEKHHKKKLVIPKKPEAEKPSKIPFLHLGEDADITMTKNNLEDAEE